MTFFKKKSFIIVSIVLMVLIAGCFIIKTNSQQKEKVKFSQFKNDFEIVNDYILSVSTDHINSSFNIIRNDEGDIISLIAFYDESTIESVELILENQIINALNNIDHNLIIGSFNYIDVTKERIDYGGLGNSLYVYSKNGKRPKYFYSPMPKKDRSFYKTYHLTDNWYLLKGSSR